jgi:hypothetical protein
MSDCDQAYVEIESPIYQVLIPDETALHIETQNDIYQVIIEESLNCLVEIGTIANQNEIIISEEQVSLVEIQEQTLEIVFPCSITINQTGTGGDGEAVISTYEAASQINVNRAVAIRSDGRIEHADKDNPANELDVIGISRQSGAIGSLIEVVEFGKLSGASFGAVGDNFFLGNNGQLVNTAPATGTWLNVGTQTSASEFLVKIGESIIRS